MSNDAAWVERTGSDGAASSGDAAALSGHAAAPSGAAAAPAGQGSFDLGVKANVAVAGCPLTAGCPVFADHVAAVDAGVVAALRSRGARVAGVTGMHELAFGITSDNAWSGPVRHPLDPDRSAGGSSGGSAAVVARGEVPLAIGTDTGGSVSIPAGVCGVVGFRPTVGRYPSDGIVGMSWSRDTVGLFARSVDTIVTADGWLADEPAAGRGGYGDGDGDGGGRGSTPYDGPRRLSVPAEFTRELDPRTAAAWERARAAVEVEWDVVEVSLAEVVEPLRHPAWQSVGYESRKLFSAFAAEALQVAPEEGWRQLLAGIASPDVAEALRRSDAAPVSAADYAQTVRRMQAARAAYDQVLRRAGCELLLFPTTPRPATRLGVNEAIDHLGRTTHVFSLMTRHTAPGTMLRAPMLTLPARVRSDELPVGITLQGRPHADRAVLAAGAQLATAIG